MTSSLPHQPPSGFTQTQAMVMGVDEFAAENIQTNNSNVETAYTAYYNVINAANTFLVHINKQIPGMTEEKRTEMIAEARCQRALAYLTLLKCFGEYWKQDSQYGVCLFKDELVRDNQVRQRSSVVDTYKLISEDLDYVFFNTLYEQQNNIWLFEECLKHVHGDTVFVFEGIKTSRKMREFWREVCCHPEVTVTIDLYSMGIVFFNKKLHKRDYIVYF